MSLLCLLCIRPPLLPGRGPVSGARALALQMHLGLRKVPLVAMKKWGVFGLFGFCEIILGGGFSCVCKKQIDF